MIKRPILTGIVAAMGVCAAVAPATAAPKLRVQVDQRGDFVLLGNTLGQECRSGTPGPVVGSVGDCGQDIVESSPDLFWRSDSPAPGQCEAQLSIAPSDARTTAMLVLPEGASVTHAFLYWAARFTGNIDTDVTLDHSNGFSSLVTADDSVEQFINQGEIHVYQSAADITSIIQQNGQGAYRIGGVDVDDVRNNNNEDTFVAWWMVVLYRLDTDITRNLAIFDGLDRVSQGNSQSAMISGFKSLNTGTQAKLGVVAFEGDNNVTGDRLFFNPSTPAMPNTTEALTDGQNPIDNFFNGTRSLVGSPVSVVGDLPQLTGTPQSMSGIDIDVIDISARFSAGQTSAPIVATSEGDLFYLAGFVTSISSYVPDFSTSTKTAKDLNGEPSYPGDTLEFTIHVINTGTDDSVDTVLRDELPPGVTFVPGSLKIIDGDNAGSKTDDPGDDQGEYDPATRTVTFRLGKGADASQGGSIAIGGSSTVSLLVTIDADAQNQISNQGVIQAGGLLGAPPRDTVTDGNGIDNGSPPTIITVVSDGVYGSGHGLFGACATGPNQDHTHTWLWLSVALGALVLRRTMNYSKQDHNPPKYDA